MSMTKVAAAGTTAFDYAPIVTAMVTKKKSGQIPRVRQPRRLPFYLREWREFMGTKVIDLAVALDIERESYHAYPVDTHIYPC